MMSPTSDPDAASRCSTSKHEIQQTTKAWIEGDLSKAIAGFWRDPFPSSGNGESREGGREDGGEGWGRREDGGPNK